MLSRKLIIVNVMAAWIGLNVSLMLSFSEILLLLLTKLVALTNFTCYLFSSRPQRIRARPRNAMCSPAIPFPHYNIVFLYSEVSGVARLGDRFPPVIGDAEDELRLSRAILTTLTFRIFPFDNRTQATRVLLSFPGNTSYTIPRHHSPLILLGVMTRTTSRFRISGSSLNHLHLLVSTGRYSLSHLWYINCDRCWTFR